MKRPASRADTKRILRQLEEVAPTAWGDKFVPLPRSVDGGNLRRSSERLRTCILVSEIPTTPPDEWSPEYVEQLRCKSGHPARFLAELNGNVDHPLALGAAEWKEVTGTGSIRAAARQLQERDERGLLTEQRVAKLRQLETATKRLALNPAA